MDEQDQSADNPPIDEVRHSGDEIVRPNESFFVKFIEVESVAHRARDRAKLRRKWVGFGAGIECPGPEETERRNAQTDEGSSCRVLKGINKLLPPGQLRRYFCSFEMARVNAF